jgi:hypothetical protein
MRYLKSYKIFEAKTEDMKWSDRDVTNKYHCALGWVRYTDAHKDSYIDIEKHFDITWDHLGWVLEDLVNKCDLLYSCRVADSYGLSPGAEDYGVHGEKAEQIVIDLIPSKDTAHSINYRTYINKFSHFPPREEDVLYKLLQGIEDKLEENFPYLTIKDEEDKWRFYVTTSQLTLKIKRK